MSWYSAWSLLLFLFRTNDEKWQLDKNNFRNCCGIFSKRAFWKLLDHSYVQSSFLTITGHIYSNLLKDTLQMNILRVWLNIRSKFFIKTLVNVMKRNSMKVAGKRSVAQNPIVHFEEHCTKTDLGSFILLFYTLLFLLNLVFKFTIALIGIFFGCFPHNLLSFLPFD